MSFSFLYKLSRSALRVIYIYCALLLPIYSLGTSNTLAQTQESREYTLKAGFIYHFTKFIQWPVLIKREIENDGLNFCLVGQDPFGNILVQLEQKLKRNGKGLLIKRQVSVDEMPKCHILFVGQLENIQLNQILSRVHKSPVLVIGDSPGYAHRGVGINFIIKNNKIRFEINREAIEQTGLRVSSELLNIATIVQGKILQ